MSDDIEGVKISGKQCNICDTHDKHMAAEMDLIKAMSKVAEDGKGRQFDCIVGISGGLDSTYLARMAESFNLRALLVHFDNGFNAPVANDNIDRVVAKTGYPFLRFSPDAVAYKRICRKLLATSLPDADIANDLGMAKLVLDVAKQYGVKWILNGHNFQYEGWNPLGWTYMDGRYLRSIAGEVPEYLDLGLLEQFTAGVKHVRPYYHLPDMSYEHMKADVAKWCGWVSYGSKHCENIYTEFVGSVYLPARGIDKRRNYLSADIRCGRISREQAKAVLEMPVEFEQKKFFELAADLGLSVGDLQRLVDAVPSMDRARFASYKSTLRRYRALVWAGMKLNLVPESFFRKYCRG
jgi:hypothetical protein